LLTRRDEKTMELIISKPGKSQQMQEEKGGRKKNSKG